MTGHVYYTFGGMFTTLHDGGNRVLMTITQDFANTQLPLEWLDPADYTPEVLEKWFKDFVAFAKQAAASRKG